MKWSLKIGRYAGIDVYMHATFFLLLGWVALIHWRQAQSLEAMIMGLLFILTIFACVTLHEFGHALTAKKYGIKTRDIMLLPIGGVARLERMPDEPLQEMWVALAGPAVNIVIAGILFIWLFLTEELNFLGRVTMFSGPFLERVMAVNLFLSLFNMIPAFPMDGGRVLRSLLATRTEYTKATQTAAYIGQGIAFLFGFIGLMGNPILLFIAFFVWIGAAQEASMAQMKVAMGGIPVNKAMLTDFQSLSPNDPLNRAVELTLAGSQRDFPIIEEERIIGVLTQSDLLEALTRRGENISVSEVMQRDFRIVDSFDMLETAFIQLKNCNCQTLPVTRFDRLVGLLTLDNVGEFIKIQAALSGSTRRLLPVE
jgi:Zn-dependent protease/predicted transcriptional regulator